MIAKIQGSHNQLLDQESDNIHHLIEIPLRKLRKSHEAVQFKCYTPKTCLQNSTYRVVCVANVHYWDSKTLNKVDIITACSWLLKSERMHREQYVSETIANNCRHTKINMRIKQKNNNNKKRPLNRGYLKHSFLKLFK